MQPSGSLDRRPVDDGDDVQGDDNISPIKMAAASAPPAPSGAATVGVGLETGLRPEPESSRAESLKSGGAGNRTRVRKTSSDWSYVRIPE
jgi:hypothetical protein